MNTNDPETSPEVQLTPVAFSPSQPDDSMGPPEPLAPPPPSQYPVFWPILIVLLTLIFSTTRDIITLNKRMVEINLEDAPALETLKKSGKQTDYIKALQADLLKLSASDPVAAQISSEFFPLAPAPAQKQASPDGAAKAPAK